MKKHSLSTILVLIILYTVLISTVLFVLYPVAFTVGAAFTKTNSLAATSISPIPKEPSVRQYPQNCGVQCSFDLGCLCNRRLYLFPF